MDQVESEPRNEPFLAIEDGNTFLSLADLNAYREQKILLAWNTEAAQ